MSDAVVAFVAHYGLWAVFVLSALESACIPVPSELVLPPAGFLAAGGSLSLSAVVILATLGNLAGSLLAYGIGRHGGRTFIARHGRWLGLSPGHLTPAEHWFARHGQATVCLARLLPAFRTFISLPAGIAAMPLARFLIYSALGALPWNLGLALAGYELGIHWTAVALWLKPLSTIALILLLVVAGLWFWRGRRRQDR